MCKHRLLYAPGNWLDQSVTSLANFVVWLFLSISREPVRQTCTLDLFFCSVVANCQIAENVSKNKNVLYCQ